MLRRVSNYVARHHWGLIATFVALGGTAYADIVLPAGSVGTRQLRANAVTLEKLSPSARAALRRTPPAKPTHVTYLVAPGAIGSSSGWRDYRTGFAEGTYYRDAGGTVHLGGVAQSYVFETSDPHVPQPNYCGAATPVHIADRTYIPDVMFVLPAADRPRATEIFAVDSGGSEGRVDVRADGHVVCQSGRGASYVSLSGISFRAAR